MQGIQFRNQIFPVTMSHHVYFCKKAMLYLSPMVLSECSGRIAAANLRPTGMPGGSPQKDTSVLAIA
jgi:hypothetical protein